MHYQPRTDAAERPKPAPCKVRVCVYPLDADDEARPEREHVVDLGNSEKARWLTNLVRWACHNSKMVEVEPYAPQDVTLSTGRGARNRTR